MVSTYPFPTPPSELIVGGSDGDYSGGNQGEKKRRTMRAGALKFKSFCLTYLVRTKFRSTIASIIAIET